MTNEQLKAIIMGILCSNGNNIVFSDLVLNNLSTNADNIINKAGVEIANNTTVTTA